MHDFLLFCFKYIFGGLSDIFFALSVACDEVILSVPDVLCMTFYFCNAIIFCCSPPQPTVNFLFYDNYRKKIIISSFLLSICRQTHDFIIHASLQRARAGNRPFARSGHMDKITHAGEQMTQWDFQNNATRMFSGYRLVDPQLL